MGGHGGLWLGIRHSDIFGSAGSTSGGVNIIPFPKNWKMADQLGDYESNKEAWRDHTVINLVPQLKPGQLNIIFDCGVDDFFFEVNNELHQALLDAILAQFNPLPAPLFQRNFHTLTSSVNDTAQAKNQ
jgi:S-formylglutathione hydrolase FrmB